MRFFGMEIFQSGGTYSSLPSVPKNEIVLFEKDTVVLGYTLLSDVDDEVIYVTKGSAAGGKYKLYNNSDLSLYSTGTLNVNSQTPIIGDGPGTCLTRQDGSVVWVISAPSNNYMNWYVVKLDTSYF